MNEFVFCIRVKLLFCRLHECKLKFNKNTANKESCKYFPDLKMFAKLSESTVSIVLY